MYHIYSVKKDRIHRKGSAMTRMISIIAASLSVSLLLNAMSPSVTGGLENVAYVLGKISDRSTTSYLITATLWILPQLILFMMFGDYLETMTIRMFTFVRIRASNLNRFLINIFIRLILWTSSYYILLIISTSLITGLRDGSFDVSVGAFLSYSLMMTSYYSFIILFQNILSILMGTAGSIMTAVAAEVAILYISISDTGMIGKAPPSWVTFLPMEELDSLTMITEAMAGLLMIAVLFCVSRICLDKKEDI